MLCNINTIDWTPIYWILGSCDFLLLVVLVTVIKFKMLDGE